MDFKFRDNLIFINGRLEYDNKIDLIINRIKQLNDMCVKHIIIVLNSAGGSIMHAYKLISAMKKSKSEIITVAFDCCSSAASLIFISGKKRFTYENTQMLIHSANIRFGCGYKTHERKRLIKIVRQKLISTYIKNTCMPKTLIKQLCLGSEGKIFNASEIIKYGIAENIINQLNDIQQYINNI